MTKLIKNYALYFSFFFCLIVSIQCGKDSPSTPAEESETSIEIDVESIATDPWWDDAVFYEIFVRSFYDSDGDGIGDLQGVIEKMDYLNDGNPNTTNDLGVTGIWLMPIFPSPSYHGYDVTDYRDINPDYGSMADFRALVQAAHVRGIKVIIDFVGNHTSDQHPWFQSSAANTAKRNWYVWNNFKPNYNGPWGQEVWHERNNNYYYGIFWGGMPDLNYNTPEVTEEIKDIVRFWYNDIGVDGFRIDAVKHWIETGSQQENTPATLNWWRNFFAFQKDISPRLMTVGEAWTSTTNIAPYSDHRLDYCFEFDLSYAIIDAVNNQNATGLRSKMNEIVGTYAAGQFGSFLTNHDQDRSFNRFGLNIRKAKLAASILLTLPGVPYLYYGEEIGMTGQKPDENIRKPMQWANETQAGFSSGQAWQAPNSNYANYNVADQLEDENSLLNHYKKMIGLRNATQQLRSGEITLVNSSASSVFSFIRKLDNEPTTYLVVHNLASARNDLPLSLNTSSLEAGNYTLFDVLSNSTLGELTVGANGAIQGTTEAVSLDGFRSYVLRLDAQ